MDFVVKEGERVKQLIQASYEAGDPEVRKREVGSLVRASRETRCEDLLVVTWDYEGEEKFYGKRVRFIPLWRWLLEG